MTGSAPAAPPGPPAPDDLTARVFRALYQGSLTCTPPAAFISQSPQHVLSASPDPAWARSPG